MRFANRFALVVIAVFSTCSSHAVTIPTVPVGNPGNPADTRYDATGFGSVGYNYLIGKTEVTNAQYAEFLNAVAASDPYALYHADMASETWGGIVRSGSAGSYTYAVKPDAIGQGPGGSNYAYVDKPVVYVSWYDALRFANWMHNGMGSGDTENGAYTLLGGTPEPSNGLSITRNAGAQWWLSSDDEWYKAAYHKNDGVTDNYWIYPMGLNGAPNNNLPSADTGNSANFYDVGHTTGNFAYPMTDAGAYTLSSSPYGTFDQGGNVYEWNESLTNSPFPSVRGGSWAFLSSALRASARSNVTPTTEINRLGFRVASISEPSADFDNNGIVDGFDFLLWQRGGSPDPFSTSDLAWWEANYGMVAPLSATSAAVPEPSTCIALLVGMMSILSRRNDVVS